MLSNNSPQCDVFYTEQSNQQIPRSSEGKKQYDRKIFPQQILRYNYKKDQWSPINPRGKKQYGLDFLLQFQFQPLSLIKPSNLPNLDIIRDKVHIQKLYEISQLVPLPKTTNLHDDFLLTFGHEEPEKNNTLKLDPRSTVLSWGQNNSCETKASTYYSDPGKTTLENSSTASSRFHDSQLPALIKKTPSTLKKRCFPLETIKSVIKEGTAIETKEEGFKKAHESEPNELRLRGAELNEELTEEKTKHLINEFLHKKNFKEAVMCIIELASPNTVHMFINAAIFIVLERSSLARHSVGQLIFSLVKQNIITFDQYKAGFTYLFEFVDEFVLDIPLIRDYVCEILEPMLEDDKYPLTFLKDILQPCVPSETAGMFVLATLHRASKKRKTTKLREVWRKSELEWTDFLGEKTNVDKFIHKHKLEFMVCSAKAQPNSTEEMKKHLLELFEKTGESEEIFDWVDANISVNKEPSFIRVLVYAVLENAIKDSDTGCELDVTKLKKRISVLSHYIDHNENLELEALYTVQSFIIRLKAKSKRKSKRKTIDLNTILHSSTNREDPFAWFATVFQRENDIDWGNAMENKDLDGILSKIFDTLKDDDVITEETFTKWKESDDADEIEGKEKALHSVENFFRWLKETDSSDL